MNWDEVEKEAVASMDKKCISNIKQKVKGDIEPFGDNFGVVVSFKEYSHKRDLLYIYSRASFVFKHEQRRPGFYAKRILFFDGKRKRCRGFIFLRGTTNVGSFFAHLPRNPHTVLAVEKDQNGIQKVYRKE